MDCALFVTTGHNQTNRSTNDEQLAFPVLEPELSGISWSMPWLLDRYFIHTDIVTDARSPYIAGSSAGMVLNMKDKSLLLFRQWEV